MALKKIINWYRYYERPISSLALIGGFVFDALTLKRVDTFWENFWIIIHLVVVAGIILILNLNLRSEEEGRSEWHFWLINIMQFAFGGLLSTFLVFYFRSATLSVSWPFLIFLIIAFVANERLKKHYERLVFQVSLLYLSLFLFLTFLVPVLLHTLGPGIFLLSGFISLGVIALFMLPLQTAKTRIAWSIGIIFVVMNLLYFTNFIPPIPLSLKDGGIYHSLVRTPSGDYELTREPFSWRNLLTLYDEVHVAPNSSLYAYTAIFSPGDFSARVIHEWEHYDEARGAWVEVARISLPVVGGRDNGYRTYSVAAIAGRSRVTVLTARGQVIGRVNFRVILTDTRPPLEKVLQ